MGHIYLSNTHKEKLLGEYVYYWLRQGGRFQNIPRYLTEYITERVGKSRKIEEPDFLSNLNLKDFNYLFNEFLKYKLERKKFDTFTLPSVLTESQFKNRAPLEIYQEKEKISYISIKNILEKGFPVIARNSLYIFYIGEDIPISVYQKFYDNKQDLKHSTNIPLEYSNKTEDINVFMLEDRDYFNTLLFLYSLAGILKEPEIRDEVKDINEIIVWKKREGSGSFFTITDLDFILRLLLSEEEVHRTNLAKFIAYLFNLRRILSNQNKEKIIEKLLDEFAYYLLVKHMLDPHVIDQVVRLTVSLYADYRMKGLNKYYVVKFMEEITGYKLDEYFELGLELRSAIYKMVRKELEQYDKNKENVSEDKDKKVFELADKIIDRLAKDLRNESLPGHFAETFERDIVWLKSRGLIISESLSEKFAKLMYDLRTSDLSKFYLIKASIILGLLSSVKISKEISLEVE